MINFDDTNRLLLEIQKLLKQQQKIEDRRKKIEKLRYNFKDNKNSL